MLPLLEQYDVPATFYITTGNVEEQQCFWWDVVYRERHRRGVEKALISREQKMLKQKRHQDIITYLQEEFGADCLQPWSDTDRPMTEPELQDFARHPWCSSAIIPAITTCWISTVRQNQPNRSTAHSRT